MPEENLSREVIRWSELDKGIVYYGTETLESLRLKNKRYYITQKVKPVNRNNNYEEPLSAISFDINKYPTLTVNNTNIYGN